MRSLIVSLLFFGLLGAEEEPQDPFAGLDPLQAAVEKMLSERESPESFKKSIQEARKLGAGKQAILEARFIFHVDRNEDDALAEMAPELVAQREKFKLSESEIFGVTEDWLAVVEYVQAIAALKKDDQASFKKHITEAFWLSPKQGVAFAPHIERLRLDKAMKKVRVDFSRTHTTVTGESVTLASITESKKALLLHFWSPWSRECEANVTDFITTEKELSSNGIPVVTVIGESEPEVFSDIDAIFSTLSKKPPGTWISDSDKASLSRQLRIQNVPMMTLVGLDGKVLFNGHPAEKRLWEKLQTISPGIKRPKSDDGH